MRRNFSCPMSPTFRLPMHNCVSFTIAYILEDDQAEMLWIGYKNVCKYWNCFAWVFIIVDELKKLFKYIWTSFEVYSNQQKSPKKTLFLVPTIINIMILDFLVSLTYIMILDQDTNSTLLMKHVFGSMSINVNGMIAKQISFRYSTCILSQFSNIPPVRVFLYSHWWLLITSESIKIL